MWTQDFNTTGRTYEDITLRAGIPMLIMFLISMKISPHPDVILTKVFPHPDIILLGMIVGVFFTLTLIMPLMFLRDIRHAKRHNFT